jgi:hypothetical protein
MDVEIFGSAANGSNVPEAAFARLEAAIRSNAKVYERLAGNVQRATGCSP